MAKSNKHKYKNVGNYILIDDDGDGQKRWKRRHQINQATGAMGRTGLDLSRQVGREVKKYRTAAETQHADEKRRAALRLGLIAAGTGIGLAGGYLVGKSNARNHFLHTPGFVGRYAEAAHARQVASDAMGNLLRNPRFGRAAVPSNVIGNAASRTGKAARLAAKAAGKLRLGDHLDKAAVFLSPLSQRAAKLAGYTDESRRALKLARQIQLAEAAAASSSSLMAGGSGLALGAQVANVISDTQDRLKQTKQNVSQEKARREELQTMHDQLLARQLRARQMQAQQYGGMGGYGPGPGPYRAYMAASAGPPRPGLIMGLDALGRKRWLQAKNAMGAANTAARTAGVHVGGAARTFRTGAMGTTAGQAARRNAVMAKRRARVLSSVVKAKSAAYDASKPGKILGGVHGTVGAVMAGGEIAGAAKRARLRAQGKLNDGGGFGQDTGGALGNYAGDRVADSVVNAIRKSGRVKGPAGFALNLGAGMIGGMAGRAAGAGAGSLADKAAAARKRRQLGRA